MNKIQPRASVTWLESYVCGGEGVLMPPPSARQCPCSPRKKRTVARAAAPSGAARDDSSASLQRCCWR
ncbi:hypothetical protein NDU88_002179 [Pleurodeles waltl]|uniref:Uncharacterized protein n=1 Tax=Pleurodeles waltl TaxID=8319 RepID=A0AAV7T213_PLEWA|nr:hypothetical protein NDU88_002179 [Pleurodeles waltl]